MYFAVAPTSALYTTATRPLLPPGYVYKAVIIAIDPNQESRSYQASAAAFRARQRRRDGATAPEASTDTGPWIIIVNGFADLYLCRFDRSENTFHNVRSDVFGKWDDVSVTRATIAHSTRYLCDASAYRLAEIVDHLAYGRCGRIYPVDRANVRCVAWWSMVIDAAMRTPISGRHRGSEVVGGVAKTLSSKHPVFELRFPRRHFDLHRGTLSRFFIFVFISPQSSNARRVR